ncbi:MAG TPA: glycosyl transferase family 1, partial [Thermotogota bacterium]|nr:glycosyl transferase family 1 [Thermotogota bacterium]
DIITFPSVQEGWGNQLLEAIFAKKIIMGYEYPVLQTDILPKGLRIVSLGKNARIGEKGLYELDWQTYAETAESLFNLITDYPESHRLVDKNWAVGAQYFSYDVLKKTMERIIDGVDWE